MHGFFTVYCKDGDLNCLHLKAKFELLPPGVIIKLSKSRVSGVSWLLTSDFVYLKCLRKCLFCENNCEQDPISHNYGVNTYSFTHTFYHFYLNTIHLNVE